jgi:16S rRNA (uracil1498-N3)-methyltransferase
LDALLIGSLEPESRPLKSCLQELRERHIGSVGLLIGPEGDFSPREYELAKQAGAIPISYGSRVLRVETAALYGVSVLAYELMEDHV